MSLSWERLIRIIYICTVFLYSLDKTNNSIHNSPPAVSDDEFSEEETDNGEVPDTNTQIYTETGLLSF